MPSPTVTPPSKPRRVPRFKDRAQALLDAYPWPDGFTVLVDRYDTAADVYISLNVNGPGERPHYATTRVPVDPYTLASADPLRVHAEAIEGFMRGSRDPRFTTESRAADLTAAVELGYEAS